jgi:hypothetical protein
MPPKRKRVRKPKEDKKKKGLKQKQKQKQIVNVQVSSGGSGGGGFVPVPSAPAIDYNLLSNLLRPASTVDVPIRAMAPIENPIATRPAEAPSLAEEMPTAKARKVRSDAGKPRIPVYERMTEREAGYETFPSESESEVLVRKKEGQAASLFKKYGGGGYMGEDPFM